MFAFAAVLAIASATISSPLPDPPAESARKPPARDAPAAEATENAAPDVGVDGRVILTAGGAAFVHAMTLVVAAGGVLGMSALGALASDAPVPSPVRAALVNITGYATFPFLFAMMFNPAFLVFGGAAILTATLSIKGRPLNRRIGYALGYIVAYIASFVLAAIPTAIAGVAAGVGTARLVGYYGVGSPSLGETAVAWVGGIVPHIVILPAATMLGVGIVAAVTANYRGESGGRVE